MLVQTITMLWQPTGIVPDQTDMMIAEGTVIKDGSIVAELEYRGVQMVNLERLVLWTLSTPVEADTVWLKIYDVDYQHTLDVDGELFDVTPSNNVWQEFYFEMPRPPEPEPPPTPTPAPEPVDVIETMLPALVVLPMIAAMSKMMK